MAAVSCTCSRASLHFAKQPHFLLGRSDIYPTSGGSAATSIKMNILCSSSCLIEWVRIYRRWWRLLNLFELEKMALVAWQLVWQWPTTFFLPFLLHFCCTSCNKKSLLSRVPPAEILKASFSAHRSSAWAAVQSTSRSSIGIKETGIIFIFLKILFHFNYR